MLVVSLESICLIRSWSSREAFWTVRESRSPRSGESSFPSSEIASGIRAKARSTYAYSRSDEPPPDSSSSMGAGILAAGAGRLVGPADDDAGRSAVSSS